MGKEKETTLGGRMKQNYEFASRSTLPMRMPVIIRLDGKSFHTWTRNLAKPFDDGFITAMVALATYLCQEIPTTQIAYVQSDEISLLLHNYKRLETQPFFGNELQKMVSVSAGLASAYFTNISGQVAVFDSRTFVLPESEVVNYFIWRQQDAIRNSVQMLARSIYQQREVQGKKNAELQEMTFRKGINWNDLPPHKRRGFAVIKKDAGWTVDWEIPLFTQRRNYIEVLLTPEDESRETQ